ncbi:hypothetical protein [Leclercia adecarboxylata]|uniref:hypothetical protein n=1 Tax=Leclercia adecarboxylata TaxID=83655 RepID=UPI0009E55A74
MLVCSQNDIGYGHRLQNVVHDSAIAVVRFLQRVQAGVDAGVFVPEPREYHQRENGKPPAPVRPEKLKSRDKRRHDNAACARL